ncbi:MAG: hypothetical protein ABI472_18700 [Ginsengibacter sp.]
MLDEEINKRISEAADQYHPAYNDEAWNRMEQMLDEHLPQKKGKRRIFFLLLFTVIVCTGLFFIFYSRDKSSPSIFSSNTFSKNIPEGDDKKAGVPTNKPSADNDNKNHGAAAVPLNKLSNTKQQKPVAPGSNTINANQEIILKNSSSNKHISIKKNETSKTSVKNVTAVTSPLDNGDKSPGTPATSNDSASKVPVTNDDFNTISVSSEQDSTKNKEMAKAENPKESKSTGKQTKINKSFGNNLGISLSAGPDASGLTVSKAGKLTIAYGAGLSYDLSRRFTLRTGFYIAKKIYSVGKNDYHTQPGSSINYTYLQSIDANCKVYEIPLIVDYNFGKVKNHNWFAAAGLSSYLMKKESYVYNYKYPSGNTYDKYWSVSNKNQHYFSVLDLSAGYEYTPNKRFSLAAEPYLKLPLSGIGAGKIKLNSAGILFTVTMKPFKK